MKILTVLCFALTVTVAVGQYPEAAKSLKNELTWLQGEAKRAKSCISDLADYKLPAVVTMIGKLNQVTRDANTVKPVVFTIYNIAVHALFGPLIPIVLPLKNEFDPIKNDIDHIVTRLNQINGHIQAWPQPLLNLKGQINNLLGGWAGMVKEIITLGLNITTNANACFVGPVSPVMSQFGTVLSYGAQVIQSSDIQKYKGKLSKAVAACEKLRDTQLPDFDKEIDILHKVASYLRPISDFVKKIRNVLDKKLCIPNPIELINEKLNLERVREKAASVVEKAREIAAIPFRLIRFRSWGKRRRRNLRSEDDFLMKKEDASQFLNKRASSVCLSVRGILSGGGVVVKALAGVANKAIQGLTGWKPNFNVATKISVPLKNARALTDGALNCLSKLPIEPADINELMDWILNIKLPLECPRDMDKLVYKLCRENGLLTAAKTRSTLKVPDSCTAISPGNILPGNIPPGLNAFSADFASICKF